MPAVFSGHLDSLRHASSYDTTIAVGGNSLKGKVGTVMHWNLTQLVV